MLKNRAPGRMAPEVQAIEVLPFHDGPASRARLDGQKPAPMAALMRSRVGRVRTAVSICGEVMMVVVWGDQGRTSPSPRTTHFRLVRPSRPTGPRAWKFVGGNADLGARPC